MRTPGKAAARRGGFTLLELLIAMTLLSLLMLGLFGGLRLGARVWEAGETEARDRTRVEAAQRFIRTYLEQARPITVADNRGEDRIAFNGRHDGLEFVATLPAHLSAGGFEDVALSFERLGDSRGLVMRHGPLGRRDDGRAELDLGRDAETATLLDNVADVEFAYFGPRDPGDDPEWTDRWENRAGVPLLVRIRVSFAQSDRRRWPELTVAPRIQSLATTTRRLRPR